MTRTDTWPNRFWGSQELPKTKRDFFNAVVAPPPSGENPEIATIRLYGPIDSWGGYWGISAKDVGGVLDALPDSVTQIILRINSPGGHVFEGISIMNLLRAHRAKVTAVVDGLAASAASVIAAGADETVMSPGTQMMIHCTSTIVWGNAVDMHKEAAVLEGLDRSLAEIYTTKAGEKDWASLLEAETWLTAKDAVDMGLANRVADIPDAGETETVGDENDELLYLPDDDEPEDTAAARIIRFVARGRSLPVAAQAAPNLPSSSEPGVPNRKENAVAYSDLQAGIRARLGVTDAAANDETLFAALDEALAEQPESTTAPIPDGTVLIDSAVLTDLQASAALGRQASEAQDTARREAIVDTAVNEGRIAPASRDMWLTNLASNEDGTVSLIASLAKNTVPVREIGKSDDITTAGDSIYDAVYGAKKEA